MSEQDFADITSGLKEADGSLVFENVENAMRKAGWERVVRCRDCEHSEQGGELCSRFADFDFSEAPRFAFVEPDGFCKWGKRRDA